MYAAMQDHDQCGRSRGLLRFGKLKLPVPLERPMPCVADSGQLQSIDWINPIQPYVREQLEPFVPRVWDARIGLKYMEGMSAAAAALDILDPSQDWKVDTVMWSIQERYTPHLNTFDSADTLFDVLVRVSRLNTVDVVPAKVTFPDPAQFDGERLQQLLLDNDVNDPNVLLLVAHDNHAARYGVPKSRGGNAAEMATFSEMSEAGILDHTNESTWSIVAAVDPDAPAASSAGVVLASTHNITAHGRLWKTSLNFLAGGIKQLAQPFLIRLHVPAASETGGAPASSVAAHHEKMKRLIGHIDSDGDGCISAAELAVALQAEGLHATAKDAGDIIASYSTLGKADDKINMSRAIALFSDVLGNNQASVVHSTNRFIL